MLLFVTGLAGCGRRHGISPVAATGDADTSDAGGDGTTPVETGSAGAAGENDAAVSDGAAGGVAVGGAGGAGVMTGGAGGNAAGGSTGQTGGAGGAAGMTAMTDPDGCSDLFDQSVVTEYSVEISADEWTKLDYEFRNRDAIEASGQNYKPYHPIVFHYRDETVADAMIRLKGQSSWRHTVRDDPNPKMQFVISFDQVNTKGKFHGVNKVVLDMPNNDATFLNERLAYAALRRLLGRPAPCANSGRITINGQYYGVYSNEEDVNHGFLKRTFPLAPDGDLFKGGRTPETNQTAPNWDRLKAFWDATDTTAAAQVVNLDDATAQWAAEMFLNDGDGYWGGSHNFYLYDYAGQGYRWLVADADATFAWLGRSDYNPIYWWAGRSTMQKPGQHYLLVINDPTWRATYIQKMQQALARWDVAQLQTWIDAWSAQIAASVADDQHKAVTVDQHTKAVAAMRQEVAARATYVGKFLMCQAGTGEQTDRDGDGAAWCNDCDDGNPQAHPGAAEICGNGIDDNCDGQKDEGCPPVDGGVPLPADGGMFPPPDGGVSTM